MTTELIQKVQERLTMLANAEADMSRLGVHFDVLDKREMLERFGRMATEALNAFNDLVMAGAPKVEGEDWLSLDSIPKDGTPFELQSSFTVRWMPYRENSTPFREGKKGRWQQFEGSSSTGDWKNCPAPVGRWRPF